MRHHRFGTLSRWARLAILGPRALVGKDGEDGPSVGLSEKRWKSVGVAQRLRYRIEFLAALPLLIVFRTLPERFARRMGEWLALTIFAVLPSRRKIGLTNLALAFPEKAPAERAAILRRSVRRLGSMFVEITRIVRMTDDEIRARITYADGALDRMPSDRGVLFCTGHLSNWELLAIGFSITCAPLRLAVRRIDNPLVNAAVHEFRTRGGNKVLERGGDEMSVRELLRYLKEGGKVGLLVDQYAIRSLAVQVPFFGHPVWCHRGPAMLAVRSGVAVVPGFIRSNPEREGHGIIDFLAELRVEDDELTGRARQLRLTELMQQSIEEEVRRYPENWMWTHRRWKHAVPNLYGERKGRGVARRRAKRKREEREARDRESEQRASA